MDRPTETIEQYKRTDPDNFQFGMEVRGGVFKFKEFDRLTFMSKYQELIELDTEEAMKFLEADFHTPDFWIEQEINLADYSEPAIENHIRGYYKSLDELKEIYGDSWQFIAAECIFEQESGLY